MNHNDIIKLIKDGLAVAGKNKIAVVPPGTPIAVLPAVVVAPGNDAMGDGNRSLRYGFDITCIVPRNNQVANYELLTELQAIVVRSLIPSQVRFEGPFVFASTGGGETGEPPALSRVIPVSFTSNEAIC